MIRGIIFDLDGTLYSSDNPLIQILDNNVEAYFIKNGINDIVGLERQIPNVLDALKNLSLNRKEYIDSVYFNLPYKSLLRNSLDLRSLLSDLDCSKFIVSLSPLAHIRCVLEALNIEDCFESVYSVCDTQSETRKGEFYARILKIYKLDPDEIICVGDSFFNDLKPAIELGLKTVLISMSSSLEISAIDYYATKTDSLNGFLRELKCTINHG